MLWTPNQVRRLCSDDHWLICLTGKSILLLTLLLSSPALATNEWTYHDYWSVYGWKQLPDLLTADLRLFKSSGNNHTVAWRIDAPPNNDNAGAILQTSTNLAEEGSWTTVTNAPVIFPSTGDRSVTLPFTEPQRFFRLMAIETNWFPIFGFAIFYNDQLEFTQSPSLTINGRVHANGKICMGAASGNTLQFLSLVTTASSIVVSNMGGYSGFSTPLYQGTPTNRVGTPKLEMFLGTNATPAALREIINIPPPGESPNSPLGRQRYYHKAALLLLVSNTTVTLTVKDQGTLTGVSSNVTYNSAAPSPPERTNLTQAFPFLSLTNEFTDFRESKRVKVTQIDIGGLKNWLTTNMMVLSRYPSSGVASYPNIMYVADLRTVTNLHAVRVVNGMVIPTNGVSAAAATGFTLATPNPLYIWGHYNSPNPSHLGTTNTTATFPASFVCDAITALSPNWTDYGYGATATPLSSRSASSTTINAAILSGVVYTTGPAVGQWSGAVQNQVRLLENWTGQTLTLNASWVNLYNSVKATTQFQNPGIYYNAPTRNFHFNQNFLNQFKLPPGTPVVSEIAPGN